MKDAIIGRRQEVILDSINEGVFTVDPQWRITAFNRAAERITGVTRKEAIGRACCDVFHASICEKDCALRRTFENGVGNPKLAGKKISQSNKAITYHF